MAGAAAPGDPTAKAMAPDDMLSVQWLPGPVQGFPGALPQQLWLLATRLSEQWLPGALVLAVVTPSYPVVSVVASGNLADSVGAAGGTVAPEGSAAGEKRGREIVCERVGGNWEWWRK